MRALTDWLKQELYLATGLPVQLGDGDTPLGEQAYWVIADVVMEPGDVFAGVRYQVQVRLVPPAAPAGDTLLETTRLMGLAERHLMTSSVRETAPALDVQVFSVGQTALRVQYEVPADAPVV